MRSHLRGAFGRDRARFKAAPELSHAKSLNVDRKERSAAGWKSCKALRVCKSRVTYRLPGSPTLSGALSRAFRSRALRAGLNNERLPVAIQKRFKKPVSIPTPFVGPRLLSLKDSASYLGAHLWAVRQMVRNQELPYVQIGRKFLIDRIDLDRYIEQNKIGVAA